MVATKIFSLYASVWEPILSNELTGKDIIEFSKKLHKLRAALSCCVCGELLTNREALSPSECREHFACKGCRGKDRDDSKKCKRCDDWSSYKEDESLTTIMRSYQDFCFYFLTKERIVRILEVKHEEDPKFDTFKLIDLVKEGLKGFQKARKRKLASYVNAARNKEQGVVPVGVDIERKVENISENSTTVAVGRSQNILLVPSNEKEISKRDTKKSGVLEGPPEKVAKPKSKSDAPVTNKIPPPASANSAKPFGPIKSTVPATASFPLKPVEPLKAAVKSPPLVTIKVEVQTTPEKSQGDGNESPTSCANFFTPDPLLDPLAETSKSPSRPIYSAARPVVTSVASPVTTSTSTTRNLPYKITPVPVVSSQTNMGSHIIQFTHPSGMKTVSLRPQQIRFTGIPGGRVQVLGPASGTTSASTTSENLRAPIITKPQTMSPNSATAPGMKRRIIFTTTATPHDLQRWPDTSKVLQFTTGDLSRFPTLAGMRSSLISVSQTSCPISGIRTASTTHLRPVVTSSTMPLVRPLHTATILTTSASPIGQTLFTSNTSQGIQGRSSNLPFVRTATPATAGSAPLGPIVRPQQGLGLPATTVSRQVPDSSPTTSCPAASVKRKPEGCRCGNATPTPGKLTCIGQRCACYVDGNACSDCKCKGCKNPYLPGLGGKKILHGVRALVDNQANPPIPILATATSLAHAPSRTTTVLSGIPTSSVTQTNPPLMTAMGPSSTFGSIQTTGGPSSMSHSHPVPPFQFIPVRFGPTGTQQYVQITNPHALHQMPIILSASGHLQASSSSGITIQGIPVSGLSASAIHQLTQHAMQQQRMSQTAQMNMKPDRSSQQE